MSLSSTNSYETIYILRPGLAESDAGTIHQKIENVITKFSGKLQARDDWGTKELAYPIEKHTNGQYCLVHYTGTSGVVEEIERHFKISGNVMRFLTVSVAADYDYAKAKKQILAIEEEVKRNRELRKKGELGGGGPRYSRE